jgi:hypothetical protein
VPRGSLLVVGTGIRAVGHVTLETVSALQRADRLLYLVTDPLTIRWLKELNPAAESLYPHYIEGRPRQEAYDAMADVTLSHVRAGARVCMALYGHPGVFAFPGHEAVKRARAEGYSAAMLPGVSAEDCLFADLGVDPAADGCQSFEATDFLLKRRAFDPRSALVLWQVGVLGQVHALRQFSTAGLRLVAEALGSVYGSAHVATLYEASVFAVCPPTISHVSLGQLPEASVSPYATLYVPPVRAGEERRPVAEAIATLLPSSP